MVKECTLFQDLLFVCPDTELFTSASHPAPMTAFTIVSLCKTTCAHTVVYVQNVAEDK